MLSIQAALDALPRTPQLLPAEVCSLDVSHDRILAEPIIAPENSPPFPKSLMDGFAVSADTLLAAPAADGFVTLDVVATLLAGQIPEITLQAGQAVRIMTGAVVPAGAFAVIPIEQTRFDEAQPAEVGLQLQQLQQGMNVLAEGANLTAGAVLLDQGVALHPGRIAALAEFGISEVPLYRRPQVAILPTGDEVVPYTQQPPPGHIRNSSQPMLAAQAIAAGAAPRLLSPVQDQPQQLAESIRTGLKSDVLLLTGGVSMGTHDFVPQELERAGVTKVFHGVHMKPGKPLWFGQWADQNHTCYVFGLPGNPVSSLVCFELFVRPLLCRMHGLPDPPRHAARLTEPFIVRGNRPVCQPAHLFLQDGVLHATPLRWTISADLHAITSANGMVLLDPQRSVQDDTLIVDAWYWYR